ncbi:phage integrase family protein [Burkholderia thailandensis E264]|uniref:Integrative genetic element Gsu32, integrase, putative n=1 Tax=Burkholderia thailandensis (strain ATCC 700388 / DSM 13276 / CCUG 48851 / CIP 106301 / E264) TaxID=271848 RepID=Q2SXA5_BURTA|nr:integrase family protein [Burkholderia thailandensis]ABC39126.1 integrative genetic element Gsu32, integrase, putative [Burkholderia thailandensis E264]AHI72825.1 phage integrase family protein [Burkholderia thailandensis 2002721723]AIP26528.1 phage integrase family protein [Burkholderia thailandensis E264]AIS97086.1 phage integrase family protein [Burkholderia thailandensis MSMB59]AJX98223.1 phage integrase family protein [Burkholderia thailandensis 2002721643]
MRFDARTAKQLSPGAHLKIDGCPGLRLEATASRRSWIYRYKSPVDGRMRQIKIGEWPALSIAAAAVEWERLKQARNVGNDPALAKRQANDSVGVMVQQGDSPTVRDICSAYLTGHVERNRQSKGAAEVARMFRTMLGDIADLPAVEVTRERAFSKIDSYRHVPVQASRLRLELGAAWDYALDAGRLPESASNWWRQIMRGRLRSNGRRIQGQPMGTAKRFLTDAEVGALITWLPNFSRNVEDALTLYLWTGTRGAEICAMEGTEITEERDGLWWTIPKVKTKSARHEKATDLRVPLVGRADAIVRRRLERYGKGWLFPAERGGHMQQKVFGQAVHCHMPYSVTRPEQERPRLPVTHWAPHDLRRTARTILAALGCPYEIGEAILGHMLPGVGGIYNRHSYDAERRHWLTKLDEKLEAATRSHQSSPSSGRSRS